MLVDGDIVAAMTTYLTVAEAALILKVHQNSVRRWLHRDIFAKVIRLPGGQYRIPADALDAMVGAEKKRAK